MRTFPMTIQEIRQEILGNKDYSMEDILFFLQEVICLYEDYDGLGECLAYICEKMKQNADGCYKEYLPLTEIFSRLCLSEKDRLLLEEQAEITNIVGTFSKIQEQYLQEEDNAAVIRQIAETSYSLNESVVHAVAAVLSAKLSGEPLLGKVGKQVMDLQNIGFLLEMLSEDSNTFALICDGNEEVDGHVLANMISRLGHRVIMLVKETEESFSDDNSAKYLDSREEIFTLEYKQDGLEDMLKKVCREAAGRMVCVVATGHVLDQLMLNMERGCEVERLSLMRTPVLQDKLTFGWAGDYLSYVSKIYKCDAHKDVEAEPKFRFSFVIPTKNSAETLRYTLMTCMNQRWRGDYEILVSDNSTEGNDDIFHLCEELKEKDERIHYVRTPRPLVIGKSFEYAFLKARGEFVIPLGADDGALPWTLEALDEVLKDVPDEILMWTRGQYQWPDYGAGISDCLTFPCHISKGTYPTGYLDGEWFLNNILQVPQTMYGLPLLYINSGFRRSYMKTLLAKTGRLWDGPCQDIFIGIVNAIIHPQVCVVNYPLTLAGMAHCSTGAQYTRQLDTLEKVNARGRNKELGENSYIGGWSSSPIERLVPRITSDIGLCYNSLIRAVAKKLLAFEAVTQIFDMKKWYTDLYGLMHKREYIYERQVMEMRYAAKLNGEAFYQWFETEFWNELMRKEEDVPPQEDMDHVKNYQTHVKENGTVVLDASKYGVKNIYQATLLVEKISNY